MAREEKKKKNRLWYMILSVIIAAIAWALVTSITDPDITKTLSGLRVELSGEDALARAGYVVTNQEELPKISVKIRAKRSDLIKALDRTRVLVDVSDINDTGSFEAEVSVKLPNSRITAERTSEQTIPVTVEKLKTKEIPVRVYQTGELPGKLVKSVSETEKVTIKGSGYELEMIEAADVVVDITNITQSDSVELGYTLALKENADRDELSTINITENLVTISNTVYTEKELPIKVYAKSENTHKLSEKDTETDPKTIKAGISDGIDIEYLTVTIDEKADDGDYKLDKREGIYIPDDRKTVNVKPVWEKIG